MSILEAGRVVGDRRGIVIRGALRGTAARGHPFRTGRSAGVSQPSALRVGVAAIAPEARYPLPPLPPLPVPPFITSEALSTLLPVSGSKVVLVTDDEFRIVPTLPLA